MENIVKIHYSGKDYIGQIVSIESECDGTVLVCMPDIFPYNSKEPFVNAKHDNRVCVARYSEYSNVWYYGDFSWMREESPTHWMPLPQPPIDKPN